MMIDGTPVRVTEEHVHRARGQLGLSSDFRLIDATRWLQFDTGNGLVTFPLPHGYFVAVFESGGGLREYGVVGMAVSTMVGRWL